MNAQPTYKLRINMKGVEIDLEGDKEFIESKLSNLDWIDAILQKIGSLPQAVQHKYIPVSKEVSFTEFSSNLNPQTHLQRILTIAYYLYKYEGRDFTYDDLETYYEQRRWPRSANPRQAVSDLIQEGYIEESGKTNGKKTFRILEKGIKYVESGFREE
ncbi:MAG: hypothetical protein QXK95_03080 [Nitrososphaerota archaeon]|nr:hypothetical protein [Candidatus Geocrenenecus dongiae]